MPAFRTVDSAHFIRDFSALALSSPLAPQFERLDRRMVFEFSDKMPCLVHDGPLVVIGNFEAPAYHVLINGDLIVNGIVDTNFDGADEGGSFFVTGNLTCNVYLGHWRKIGMIGGDLSARDLLLNAYEDSCLIVGGTLRTRFFLGQDIWADVGRDAEMEYGVGYCLPFGYFDAVTEAILPRHNEKESEALLAFDNAAGLNGGEMANRIRDGASIFR